MENFVQNSNQKNIVTSDLQMIQRLLLARQDQCFFRFCARMFSKVFLNHYATETLLIYGFNSVLLSAT